MGRGRGRDVLSRAMCRGPEPAGCSISPWMLNTPGVSGELCTSRQILSAPYITQPTRCEQQSTNNVLRIKKEREEKGTGGWGNGRATRTKSGTSTSPLFSTAMCGWETVAGKVMSCAESVSNVSGSSGAVGMIMPLPVLYCGANVNVNVTIHVRKGQDERHGYRQKAHEIIKRSGFRLAEQRERTGTNVHHRDLACAERDGEGRCVSSRRDRVYRIAQRARVSVNDEALQSSRRVLVHCAARQERGRGRQTIRYDRRKHHKSIRRRRKDA
jgi:hypothetical protein